MPEGSMLEKSDSWISMMIFQKFILDGSRPQWMSELPDNQAGLKVLLWVARIL
jgi:hypothetical protein